MGSFLLGFQNLSLNFIVQLTVIDGFIEISSVLHFNIVQSFIDRLVLCLDKVFSALIILSESSAFD
jgi:hypothetical protein